MPIGKNRLIWDLPDRIGDRLIPDPKASVPACFGSSAAAPFRSLEVRVLYCTDIVVTPGYGPRLRLAWR
jgi:hypothetical protein